MNVQYLPGFYIDVAVWIDGRLLAMTADGALVRCYLEPSIKNPQPIWQQNTAENLLFGRCAVQGQKFVTIHKGQSGSAMLVGEGLTRYMGMSGPSQSVGIDGNNAYVVRGAGATYDRIGLIEQPYPSPVPDSSQGISDVQPDGTLWWLDLHRTMVVNGVTFTYPNQRYSVDAGAVTVGQVEGGIMAAFAGKNTLVIPSAGAYEPHVAVSPNGRVAICARTGQGAAYVATTIHELSA